MRRRYKIGLSVWPGVEGSELRMGLHWRVGAHRCGGIALSGCVAASPVAGLLRSCQRRSLPPGVLYFAISTELAVPLRLVQCHD